MPEYLAPGVYVEEVSFRPRSIEGVSTSTTAFIGPTRRGPVNQTPEIITSYGEFARVYGGSRNLSFKKDEDSSPAATNFIAHAVRAFFNNGGSRLFVARTFTKRNDSDGVAKSADITVGGGKANFVAMGAGAGYNGTISLKAKVLPAKKATLLAAPSGSLISMTKAAGGGGAATLQFLQKVGPVWRDATKLTDATTNLDLTQDLPTDTALYLVRASVEDGDGTTIVYDDLGLAGDHPRFIGVVLSKTPARRTDALENPYFLDLSAPASGADLLKAFFKDPIKDGSTNVISVTGGNDGVEPDATTAANALELLEAIEDISIVAAPGFSNFGADANAKQTNAVKIYNALIIHAEKMKYRVAVLDSVPGQGINETRGARSEIDSKRAAFYYPWVVVDNPLADPNNDQIPREVTVPPAGFVCGIYARNDNQNGVWKAPANEIVLGALRFEREINFAQQEILNPDGINCLRYFFGRGNRVWGARTTSSDPEWKYLNVRRYFNYLERSIDRSTQWAVFEPNGERLWASIRGAVSDFLYNEWKSGALLGATPEEAFFVRCDRSTMTQADLDNGRLICEIGVAVLKPAEFVIFRIGQKTADART